MSNIRRTDIGISGRRPVGISSVPATSMAPVGLHDHRHFDDAEFDAFNEAMRRHFEISKLEHGPLVFTTDADPTTIIHEYLAGFSDPTQRQVHNCDCCKSFLRRYGSLVFVRADGRQVPALWGDSASHFDFPQMYRTSVATMKNIVAEARITGPFLHSDRKWGTIRAGGWTHMSIDHMNSNTNFFFKKPRDKEIHEVVADKKQHFETILRTLESYSMQTLVQAVSLLEADAFYRSEAVLGAATWLRDLYFELDRTLAGRRMNRIWVAATTAPIGFVNIRAGVLGTLLDDLKAGKSVDSAARAFGQKMQPDKYGRPQAAPSAGAVAAAERKVEKMGIERSLPRRFARMSDIQTVWAPNSRNPVRQTAQAGVFSSVKTKADKRLPVPSLNSEGEVMTWSRFQRSVLPNVESMEIFVPSGKLPLGAFVTAVNADAPPIVQWDDETRRNPVSWYLYTGGSTASTWSLRTGWQKVKGISLLPHMWDEDARRRSNQRNGAMFIIDGCRDVTGNAGSGLFPEILKSDMHSMRSVIEAFSSANKLQNPLQAEVCGLIFDDGIAIRVNVALRGSVSAVYTIKKWD